jgi:hypothetical protein
MDAYKFFTGLFIFTVCAFGVIVFWASKPTTAAPPAPAKPWAFGDDAASAYSKRVMNGGGGTGRSETEIKCSAFADAKSLSGGSRQLSYNSCMQFDGDPADAWIERTGATY